MSQEFVITQLEETIDQMQEIIASLEMDIELMKMEIVQRGDCILRLESQNRVLKKQILEEAMDQSKIPMLLRAKEIDG